MPEFSDKPNDFQLDKIPEKMVELRNHILCSQRVIARWAGMTTTTYQRIETGEKSPTLEQLDRIARALKVSFGELTGLTQKPGFAARSYCYPNTYRCYLTNIIHYGAGRDGKIPKRKLISLLYWCELIWYFENACSGLTKEIYYKTKFGPLAGIFFEVCEALENEGKLARTYLGQTTFLYLVEGSPERGRIGRDKIKFIQNFAGFWRNRPTDELVQVIARQTAWRRADAEQEIDFHEAVHDAPQRLYGAAIRLAPAEE